MVHPDVLSCIQPTAGLHIGNYFGAIKNWVDLQASHACIYGIVDLHAMTMPYDPAQLRINTWNMAVDLLACGLDPGETILFIQSLVPEHAELAWVFQCISPFGELTRMTQFKDKSDLLKDKSKEAAISVGLFAYPVLQAADILIYRASHVPVGKDQVQHVELSRVVARRFNAQFGELFPEPKPLLTKAAKIQSPADPSKKMSKSLGDKHCIGLFEEPDSIRKKLKTAVTDTGVLPEGMDMGPGVANLFEILEACGQLSDSGRLKAEYHAGTLRYSELKEAVAEALIATIEPLRQKRAALLNDMPSVEKTLYEGSSRARAIAAATLKEVRALTGLPEHH